ncbi:MAG: histidine kinase [Vulcanimicrobiota bacterium]
MARELELLEQIAEVLNRTPDLSRALTDALALTADLLGLEAGWVWLTEGDGFFLAASHRLPEVLREPVRMVGKSCRCLDAYRQGELSSRGQVIPCSRLAAAGEPAGHHASLTLAFAGRKLGVLNIASCDWRHLDEHQLSLLAVAAHQMGVAVERARLAEDERRLARETERTRLAREMHDGLVQDLTAIALGLESALARPELARERTERALQQTRRGLERARQSMTNLRGELPLPEALATLARAFTHRTGIPVDLECQAAGWSPQQEQELLAIAGEALVNVERHAGATRVQLRLAPNGLEITDNGRGFDLDQVEPGRYGLIGMSERARLLGGSLEIRRQNGTRVVVRL